MTRTSYILSSVSSFFLYNFLSAVTIRTLHTPTTVHHHKSSNVIVVVYYTTTKTVAFFLYSYLLSTIHVIKALIRILMRVNIIFSTPTTTSTKPLQQEEDEQEVRVSELFNTLLFTQQQEEEQEVRVSELFNTLLFTRRRTRSESKSIIQHSSLHSTTREVVVVL